jgi:hypothetical protein
MIVLLGCVQQEQDVLLVSYVVDHRSLAVLKGFRLVLVVLIPSWSIAGWEILRAPDGFLASLSGPKSGSVSRSS